MQGFLYSLWARVEELGGVIYDRGGLVTGVTFPNEATAQGFVDTAHNMEIWFDALTSRIDLVRDGTEVKLVQPK